MAIRTPNERRDLLESMLEPDGVLLTTPELTFRRGTRRELVNLLAENGLDRLRAILSELDLILQSEIDEQLARQAYKTMCASRALVIAQPDDTPVGTLIVEYEDETNPPRVTVAMAKPATPADRGQAVLAIFDVLHRLNGDEAIVLHCEPYNFENRAELERMGASLCGFIPYEGFPREDCELFAASCGDLYDEEIRGLAEGFGVSGPELFCGTLVYRLEWGAPRQCVTDERFGSGEVGFEKLAWWTRDVAMHLSAVVDLMKGGHPFKALRAVREAVAKLRKTGKAIGKTSEKLDVVEADLKEIERYLRERGEEE